MYHIGFKKSIKPLYKGSYSIELDIVIKEAEIEMETQKSKIAAGLFGIFLGIFGVHNFYLGYTGKAVAQLSVTIVGFLLTCCFGLGILLILAVEIWGLVEGILILTGSISTDANGVTLRD